MSKYDDIINLPRYEIKHKRMSIESRSAQFSPFSALTGYEDEVHEIGRLTDSRIELSDEQKENISYKLQDAIDNNREVIVTYFVKDLKKSGGKYLDKIGVIKKYDLIKKEIIFFDKISIPIMDVIDIKKYIK